MITQTLISETIRLVGKTNFVLELDAIGWRGDYSSNPARYLADYVKNSPAEDQIEADSIVRNDMIVILRMYGLDYESDEIINIIAT